MAQALFTTQADEDVLLVWNYIARFDQKRGRIL